MKYEVGDTVFFLESNRFVRKETDLLIAGCTDERR